MTLRFQTAYNTTTPEAVRGLSILSSPPFLLTMYQPGELLTALVQKHSNCFGVLNFNDRVRSDTFAAASKDLFNRQQTAPFIRVLASANVTAVDDIVHAVVKIVKARNHEYRTPSLILSVTGGAKSFNLPVALHDLVSSGLKTTFEKTNAWVVTGGSHSGVMKLTGELIAQARLDYPVPVIGIATWGAIHETSNLEQAFSSTPKGALNYPSHKTNSLDPNHNFFLLADDGSRGEFGKEMEFRASFEARAAKYLGKNDLESASHETTIHLPRKDTFFPANSDENDVPVVCVMVQGGPGTLKTVWESVKQNQPVVIVKGSGMAADLLAYVWTATYTADKIVPTNTPNSLSTLITATFGFHDAKKIREAEEQINEIVKNRGLVIIFDADAKDNTFPTLDKAIFEAVLRKKMPSTTLQHARIWGEAIAARQCLGDQRQILAEALEKKKDSLPKDSEKFDLIMAKALYEAIRANDATFTELYLNNGAQLANLRLVVNNGDSITKVLGHLYADAIQDTKFGVACALFGDRTAADLKTENGLQKYVYDTLNKFLRDIVPLKSSSLTQSETMASIDSLESDVVMQHFMIWALATDKSELATVFMRRTKHILANALLASTLLRKICRDGAMKKVYLADERAILNAAADDFESFAAGAIEECHQLNSDSTHRMLTSEICFDNSKFTLLRLALRGKCIKFMSQQAAVAGVNHAWFNGMSPRTAVWKLYLYFFMFPFIFIATITFSFRNKPVYLSLIEFLPENHDALVKKRAANKMLEGSKFDAMDADASATENSHAYCNLACFESFFKCHNHHEGMSGIKKLYRFYTSPVLSFWLDTLAYCALIGLYTFMLLTPFQSKLANAEWVLLGWFGTLLIDELRQYFERGWRTYFYDNWNRLDVVIISFYTIAFMCRISDLNSVYLQNDAKIIFSINAIPLLLRLTRFYAANQELGPKLIMMHGMMRDLLSFAAFILVLLLGFGLAITGILNPFTDFNSATATTVLYRPYYHIFGENFIDDFAHESSCTVAWPFLGSCGLRGAWLIPVLVAIYLLFANILLVNLLIAMFNDTYSRIQGKSRNLWNRQNFELYVEYHSRSLFLGPTVIIYDIYLLIKYFCCSSNTANGHHPQYEFISQGVARYVARTEAENEAKDSQVLRKTGAVVQSASSRIDEIHAHLHRLDQKVQLLLSRFTLQSAPSFLQTNLRADSMAESPAPLETPNAAMSTETRPVVARGNSKRLSANFSTVPTTETAASPPASPSRFSTAGLFSQAPESELCTLVTRIASAPLVADTLPLEFIGVKNAGDDFWSLPQKAVAGTDVITVDAALELLSLKTTTMTPRAITNTLNALKKCERPDFTSTMQRRAGQAILKMKVKHFHDSVGDATQAMKLAPDMAWVRLDDSTYINERHAGLLAAASSNLS